MSRRPPNPVCILRGHSYPVSCLDYDEDNNCLISGYIEIFIMLTYYRTQNGTVVIWNTVARSIKSYKEYYHSGGVLQTQFISTDRFFT